MMDIDAAVEAGFVVDAEADGLTGINQPLLEEWDDEEHDGIRKVWTSYKQYLWYDFELAQEVDEEPDKLKAYAWVR